MLTEKERINPRIVRSAILGVRITKQWYSVPVSPTHRGHYRHSHRKHRKQGKENAAVFGDRHHSRITCHKLSNERPHQQERQGKANGQNNSDSI